MTNAPQVRTCASCGKPEVRSMKHGREQTNISPLTGTCLDCVIGFAKEAGRELEPEPEPFDARKAAANDGD